MACVLGLHAAVSPVLGAVPAVGTTASAVGSARAVWKTGDGSSLVIDGPGYFVLQAHRPQTWTYALTRSGYFWLDDRGRLSSPDGGWVMGFGPDGVTLEPVVVKSPGGMRFLLTNHEPGNPPGSMHGGAAGGTSAAPDARLMGPLTEPQTWDGSKGWVAPNGEVIWERLDGTQEVIARIALAMPGPNQRLERFSERLYRVSGRGETGLPQMHRPGAGGAGWLRSGEWEAPTPGLKVGFSDRATMGHSLAIPVWIPFGFSVALEGPGCLVVRDPASDERYLTRCGLLKLDSEGWLVTDQRGYRVQGFSDTPFPGVRDLRVPQEWDEAESGWRSGPGWVSVVLDDHGYLLGMTTDGVTIRLGRLKIDRAARVGTSVSASEPFWKAEPVSADVAETGMGGPVFEGGTSIWVNHADPRYLDQEAVRRLNHRARFMQHRLERGALPTSLAIGGPGQFLVRDPVRGIVWMTRLGRFRWSDDGYLENDRGWRVQGLRSPWQSRLEDVWAPILEAKNGIPGESRTIHSDGKVWVLRRDGSEEVVAWIQLAGEIDPSHWEEGEPWHFRIPGKAGEAQVPRWNRPRTHGLGEVHSGALEMLEESQSFFPSHVPAKARQLVLWGLGGRAGRIEVSPDARVWHDWLEFRDMDGFLRLQRASGVPGEAPVVLENHVLDPDAVEAPTRFYRIVVDEENFEGEAMFR
jgi:flagellar hook protein FlgE